jgi:hypothetical protein
MSLKSAIQGEGMNPEDYWKYTMKRHNIDEKTGSIEEIVEGGTKHDNGKPDLSLVPYSFLMEVAKALMYGEKKYGRYNFEKGFPTHRLLSAALRHIWAYVNGEDKDPESGLSHLAHAGASLAMLVRCLELGTATDTRSPNRSKG